MSKATARHILELHLSDDQKRRAHELTVRNQDGELTGEEKAELDRLTHIGALLSLLKVRARVALK